MDMLHADPAALWSSTRCSPSVTLEGVVDYANGRYFYVYLQTVTRRDGHAMFTAQLGDGSYFAVNNTQILPNNRPASTPLSRAG